MKKSDRSMILSGGWILVGLTLLALGIAGVVDEYWSGMGTALVFVGVLQLIRRLRLYKDEEYREKVTVALTDERNRFLRNKAWAWAGYLFLLIAAVLSIVLKIAGQELLSKAAGMAVCGMTLLYWMSYGILRKKY